MPTHTHVNYREYCAALQTNKNAIAMKIKKKYVTAIAAATIIITAIIIHCYTLGMTNTEVERIPMRMAQGGD